MAVLEAHHLSKWYGPVVAVNDLSVEIEPGITGLLGPNGAGKSTFMRMLMGLMRPSQGHLEVLGEDPWRNPKLLARIGFVPEGPAPWREKTTRECVTLAARLTGLPRDEAVPAADAAVEKAGLTAEANRPVETLSRGMQQRVKLALALVHDPELLILDEPLLGTDPLVRSDLIQLIRGFARDGKSILVSTHVLPDVEAMTDRIFLMNRGRRVAYGEVEKIRDLMEQYPRTVRVQTPDPRKLASAVMGWSSVLSAHAEPGAVLVKTHEVQAFYAELQKFLAEGGAPFVSVSPVDDDVESVFRLLVGYK